MSPLKERVGRVHTWLEVEHFRPQVLPTGQCRLLTLIKELGWQDPCNGEVTCFHHPPAKAPLLAQVLIELLRYLLLAVQFLLN